MPVTDTTRQSYHNGASPQDILADRLEDLNVGTPLTWAGLTLVPLHSGADSAPVDYETLVTSLAGRRARVTEIGGGSVPELGVKQAGPLPVLLLDGDQLVGGRQNRVLNTTILVPVGIDFVVPVSCVEQGRWHATRADFGSGEIVPPSLRYRKGVSVSESYRQGSRARANQGEVWASVDAALHQSAAYSSTSDLYEAYRQAEARIEETRRQLGAAVPGAVGVVAIIGGRAIAADLFDKPETLAEFWPRLVRSYAIEAEAATPTDGAAAVAAARALVDAGARAARATSTAHPAHGLGDDVRVTAPEVAGAALVHAGVAIHAVLFGTGATAPRLPGNRTTTRPATGTGDDPGGGSADVAGTSSLFQAVFGATAGRADAATDASPTGLATSTTRAAVPSQAVAHEAIVVATRLQVVQGDLLDTGCGAIVVGANKRLSGASGLPGAIERAAGPTFVAERDRRILAAPAGGFFRGTALITGSGHLRDGRARRALIHAIVTKYEHGSRVPTTPDLVYAAMRAALELAETYHVESVATHPIAMRATPPGMTPLATAPAAVMARALFDAIVDHARVARRVVRVQVYERDAARLDDLARALAQASTGA